MKFTLVKNLKADPLMRPILLGLLIFTTLFLLSDFIIMIDFFGSSWQAINDTFYGNEEEFIDPLSWGALLEIVHKNIFFMMMTLMILVTIFIRLHKQNETTKFLVHLIMITALLSIITFVTAFYIPHYVLLFWLVSTLLWHILALYMSLSSTFKLV
jgi:hypothetical protein